MVVEAVSVSPLKRHLSVGRAEEERLSVFGDNRIADRPDDRGGGLRENLLLATGVGSGCATVGGVRRLPHAASKWVLLLQRRLAGRANTARSVSHRRDPSGHRFRRRAPQACLRARHFQPDPRCRPDRRSSRGGYRQRHPLRRFPPCVRHLCRHSPVGPRRSFRPMELRDRADLCFLPSDRRWRWVSTDSLSPRSSPAISFVIWSCRTPFPRRRGQGAPRDQHQHEAAHHRVVPDSIRDIDEPKNQRARD